MNNAGYVFRIREQGSLSEYVGYARSISESACTSSGELPSEHLLPHTYA